MREYADPARKDEQSAPELPREAEHAVDHGEGARDVHRDGAALAPPERRLDQPADGGMAARDLAARAGGVDQAEQPARAGIDRMEAVAEARNDLAALCDERVQGHLDRILQFQPRFSL